MKRLIGALTLGLAIVGGSAAADASVPLPVLEQTSGARSLAPLLKQISPAVVSIAVKGRATPPKNSASTKDQRLPRSARA